ncbi:MAG: hypothetical protein A2268_04075 [Candidatus Raymondbacteria bacterium RifOxyA12_full_50_37]|uniref:Uncharacterized protein n=1 Tax=Candidatus Raymondbacteria bacterium RIFOXYD12_FULL_49_13 TaxID=1817890 RepID=A0A1F7FAS3_UNCRA|nr:MAG: hypothetical protein A2268_04075 [Candidatus Raymondbacteria bacterium RifOxyA12_full_50_37]OGJ92597.1 MAG: hypothetical protein A2248_05875 [Candidatus Raymondbacteria bacterium RIFOXYA2_FULL_49_16]OGJ92706.1 MAG: hypothetical protein A2350_16695 [Candidatus Raymondbacteria bacterium RifOxyB12_full_50_8]OGJ97951.1 MAG: hypothetical protein A2453_02900 [Candidatus Raymondbacteria bacterium RIFOXYC2_FULL_50_21]OGK02049.1 MAG: hypothetical protein A2487_01305 [Candidatus Raymondbacteria b
MKDAFSDKFYFTVGKLIDVLKSFPPDMPVLTSGYKTGFENFHHPSVLKMKHDPESWWEDGEFQIARDRDMEAFEAVVLQRVNRDD